MGKATREPRRRARGVRALAAACALAGCGGTGAPAPLTLGFYAPPDVSGAYRRIAEACAARSGGRYRIDYRPLPSAADAQRQQLVRRLAAHDASMDVLGVDVTWPAELAAAGWIEAWPEDLAAELTRGTLETAVDAGMWQGRLMAAPFVTNVQLLWYRSDLVPEPPATWDEMIRMAERLAREGKPHAIVVQGAQYEGVVVWFNTLVASAGGSILAPDSDAPALGRPALTALRTMKRLAASPAADPSLATAMEDQTRLAMEAGTAAFELNWPYVWPSMQANRPVSGGTELADVFRWAPYPAIDPDRPARVTTGGLSLAVSRYSRHPELAFEAALCLRSERSQRIAALEGGFPPTLERFYEHPDEEFARRYPFYATIYEELKNASNRPQTPAYQSVSIVIAHALSPPRAIDPVPTLAALEHGIENALASRGLVP